MQFLNRNLNRVSELCDHWGMRLNVTETTMVSRSHTMSPQSPPLTLGGTVVKESLDLDILGVAFDAQMTHEA